MRKHAKAVGAYSHIYMATVRLHLARSLTTCVGVQSCGGAQALPHLWTCVNGYRGAVVSDRVSPPPPSLSLSRMNKALASASRYLLDTQWMLCSSLIIIPVVNIPPYVPARRRRDVLGTPRELECYVRISSIVQEMLAILAEGAIALPVTLSGGVLFAS